MLPSSSPKSTSDLGLLLTLGWGIAIWMTLGVLLGRWVDGHWGSQPWGILGGSLWGLVGSGLTVYRVVRRLDARDKQS